MKKRTHKKTPKKLKRKSKSTKKNFTLLSIIFVTILLTITTISFFYIDKHEINIDIKNDNIIQIKTKKEKPVTFEEKTKALEIEYIENTDNNIYIEKQEIKIKEKSVFHYEEPNYGKIDEIKTKEKIKEKIKFTSPQEEVIITPMIKITKPKIKKIIQKEKKQYKPLLAIIIDDVTTSSQIKKIKNIGYNINMAFLPPTPSHKNSAKITKKLNNYMIHLPLQASNSRYEENNTLYITDNIKTIEKRIKLLQKLYPKAKFINNHTGSKFTSNIQAMDKLFQVLKKYNYTFVDSRTTAASVASLSAKKYGVRMLSRNIFLDNKKNKKYIQTQLKKAIKNAKKNGSAIAIGHPYNITFSTLKESKHLLDDIELVYINQI